jgi:bacillithiol biosynthesis cysteine-adding enzyme BshC
MNCRSTRIPYKQTKAFSSLVLDYLDRHENLRNFYSNEASITGIKKSIENRKGKTDRVALVAALENQYKSIEHCTLVKENIQRLSNEDCYTVTTAHQNNIFTGPLYFIYKILHVIKLAEHFQQLIPTASFVPVFYLGSEDADLQELNHIYVNGKELKWNTNQLGAVGRMKADEDLIRVKEELKILLNELPAAASLEKILDKVIKKGSTIAEITFLLVNELFGKYGLVVIQPDQPALKKLMIPLFKKELLGSNTKQLVSETSSLLEKKAYSVQANPREINLFYLQEGSRERIEKIQDGWQVVNSNIKFSEKALIDELANHPERFSPNVILRPLYQSTILPDIAFVGGGGELAYWFQLKKVFEENQVPYPVLLLRNSFLLLTKEQLHHVAKLQLDISKLFLSEQELMVEWLTQHGEKVFSSSGEVDAMINLYQELGVKVGKIDPTLQVHTQALAEKAINKLKELDKKVIRAQKRKYPEQQLYISILKQQLFPFGGLQERTENVFYYLANWGLEFIDELLAHSMTMEQEFVILEEV